ncbi:hypothetical protein FQR65_LT08056 [Abscondita terminalis]|nr:hypothetical protein FQR65_LT08056 [Abscondita terminalis]
MSSYTICILLFVNLSVSCTIVTAYLNPKLDYIITSVIKKLYHEEDTLTFVYDNVVRLELPEDIKNTHVISRADNPMRLHLTYLHSFIIHLSNQTTLNRTYYFIADEIHRDKNFLPNGKFLIIINEKNLGNLNEVFQYFWIKEIYEVVVLTYYFGNKVSIKLHTIDELEEGNECGKKSNVIHSEYYHEQMTIKFVKKYSNIHGCNIVVHFTYTTPPVHLNYIFKLLDILGNAINGVVLRESSDDRIGVWLDTGFFYPLLEIERTNIAIRDPFYFVVKGGAEISPTKILFIIFTFEVWIFIMIAYIITSIAMWFITSIDKKKFKISKLGKHSLEVFSATVWGTIPTTPQRTHVRCLFICYLLYYIHIQTGFTSNLATILTTPQFEHGITNFEELAEANITIYASFFHYLAVTGDYSYTNTFLELIQSKTKPISPMDMENRNYSDIIIRDNNFTAYVNPKLDYSITSVIKKLYHEEDTLTFVYDNVVRLELPEDIKNTHVISRADNPMRLHLTYLHSFIIHLSNQTTLNRTYYFIANEIHRYKNFLPKGKFLIIINEKNLGNLNEVFQYFWIKDIHEVVVLTYYFGSKVSIKVHTIDEFEEGNECGKKSNVIHSQYYHEQMTIKFVKKYWNIHECKIVVHFTYTTPPLHLNYIFKLLDILANTINGVVLREPSEDEIGVWLDTGFFYTISEIERINIAIRDPFYIVVK